MVAEGSKRAGTGDSSGSKKQQEGWHWRSDNSGSRRDQTDLGRENAEGLQFERRKETKFQTNGISIRKLVGGLYPKESSGSFRGS